MSNRLGERVKRTWQRTARWRHGARAAIRGGSLVVGTVRAINAPVPPQPDVARTQDAAVRRQVDREVAARLRDYGTYEINRRRDEQSRQVQNPPTQAPAAERRTREAVQRTEARGSGKARGRGQGRSSGGRGR